jgi:hypothetical protein
MDFVLERVSDFLHNVAALKISKAATFIKIYCRQLIAEFYPKDDNMEKTKN